VRDNGVGITREELPHVTTRFFRGRPVTPDGQAIRVPGSGQGLFTANQIIEAHGGSMEVRSKLTVGTAVYFSLPLTAEQVYELPHFSTQFEGETLPLDVDDKKSDS
jgi:signal transduction histidine kinase